MTPEQVRLVEELLENSLGVWEDDGSGDDDQASKRQTLDAFRELVAEHAAMKGQLRWRKQSEEKAPDDMFVQWRSKREEDFGCHDHCLGADVPSFAEWLPVLHD